ncbi:MAG: hypothetical protein ACT4P6_12240 [Gemmatimonadaceae bacterium]
MLNLTRFLVALLSVAAIVALVWILSLPNKAECVASGRTVDPTERHCDSADGYQQLEEHAFFHATPVALGVAVLLAGGFAVRRVVRRRSVGTALNRREDP